MKIKGKSQWRKAITHCPKGHEYTIDNTYFNTNGSRTCKKCSKERATLYSKNNPEKGRERARKYISNNREISRESVRKSRIKSFGITLDDYNNFLEKQNGKCAICKKECKSKRNLAIDHCHTTGKVRGLLCCKCNRALGLFDDNTDYLKTAICYLNNDIEQ